jgi:DNA repair protein RecO
MVVRVLTPNVGAISLLAKGVNRLKSGALGILDTWALVEIEFGGRDGAEMLNLYNCSLLDRMSGLSADQYRLAVAAILAELAELGSPPMQSSAPLFLWLQDHLNQLAEGAPAPSLLVAALLKGLSELGLDPNLEFPQGADSNAELWFSPASGGVVAPPNGTRPDVHARPLSAATLALLRELRDHPEKHALANCGEVEQCLTILGDFLHYHLERPPKAWHLLHRLAASPLRRP